MTTVKRPWRTPELMVLVRSRPEESVLTACKGGGMLGPSDPGQKCKKKDASPCMLPGRS
jgi:hypothetical protein